MKFNSKLFLLAIILTIIFYSILIMSTDLRTLYSGLKSFKVGYLPLIMALISFGWVLLFKRWDMLLKNLGITIPLKSNVGIFLAGFAMGFTPGRLGELFKSQMIKDKHDISRTKTASLVIIERLYDAVGAIITSLIGLTFLPIVGYVITIFAILVVLVFVSFSSKILFDKFLTIINKIKFLSKLAQPLSESYDAVRNSTRGKIMIFSTLLSIAYWLVTSLAVYFIFISYGIENLDFLHTIPTVAMSSFLGAISFIPGGIGITEGSFAGFLILLHVNSSSAVALTILVRIFTLWYGVIVGFIALKLSKGILLKK